MAKNKARVAIIEHIGSTKTHAILPTNVTTKQVLPHLIKALKLPTDGPGGVPLLYRLALEADEGRVHLKEDEVLAEAGVQDGTVLRLMPEMPAGEPSPPLQYAEIEDWKYLDFELQINPVGDGYQAEVLASPAGEASEVFLLPDSLMIENFILRIGRTRRGLRLAKSPEWIAAREFGGDLFRRLFHGEILACLKTSLQEADEQDCGLRLKLRLDKAPDLMSVPWEFLYYSSRRMFLAPQEDMPIVRFLSAVTQRRPMRAELPLRILVMAASPADLPPLSVDEERDKLARALQPLIDTGMAVIEWVEGGSMSALYQHLTTSFVPHHVFHFIGHGGFDVSSGEGFLAMEGRGGRWEPITGERLAPLLRAGRRRFRLAVLNTCEGARTGLADPFSGVATSLIPACNLPAVVAMQFEITDEAAIAFAANFYAALATGRPVDTAVTAARLAIFATHNDVEWGTPVLYMRSPDGQLFDFRC